MDAKLIEPNKGVPFSNSMEDDNLPSNSDGEGPGGDQRPVQMRPQTTQDGVNNGSVNYPLPPDVNSPRPDDNTVLDMGMKQDMVGHNGSAHSYGLASGEVRQDAADDSVAGQGFGK